MKMTLRKGFSAAELLIAIFVGAAFILTGYQLYGIIVNDGGDARTQAVASNLAYSQLRTSAARVGDTCSSSLTLGNIPSDSHLSSATMFILTTCPYGTASPISRVNIIVSYGSGQQVQHGMYASQ